MVLTTIGILVIWTGLSTMMAGWMARSASHMSLPGPIALAGAVAALVVAGMSYARIGQVQRQYGSQ